MLSLDQVKQEYPLEIFKRNSRSVLVEYLQYEILDSLFKQKGSEFLSFMGGTAVRIAYSSARFSEDLDFDNFGLSFKEFEKILEKVKEDMRFKGFTAEFRLVEKGAYHCYIKFPKILFENNLSEYKDEKILVRIDAVHKKRYFVSDIFTLNRFDVYRAIAVNPLAIILAQKIITIIERKREKGRDFYDVSYLLGRSDPDYSYAQKEYGLSKKEIKNKLVKRINELDMKELARDVLPFLMNPDDQRRILGFGEYIEQKI